MSVAGQCPHCHFLVQANQTIATDSNPSGCTRTSGVAPALVAAIEGAAQCLVSGGVGAFQCQVAYIANASACSQMHCFPGEKALGLHDSLLVFASVSVKNKPAELTHHIPGFAAEHLGGEMLGSHDFGKHKDRARGKEKTCRAAQGTPK